jgi:hypothetical protein
MPRSFDMATEYESSVANVHRTLRSKEYWLARLADSGVDEARLDSITLGTDGGVEVVTTQVIGSSRLPGFVSQFHRGDLQIRREETWTPLIDRRATAAITGGIAGAPVRVDGAAELAPSDAGARLSFNATVTVRVPLVGGKLETFIGNQLVDLLNAEQRFTTRWLAEDS